MSTVHIHTRSRQICVIFNKEVIGIFSERKRRPTGETTVQTNRYDRLNRPDLSSAGNSIKCRLHGSRKKDNHKLQWYLVMVGYASRSSPLNSFRY